MYVVGVPDKRLGEELCACIKLKTGEKTLGADEVKAFCKDKVSICVLFEQTCAIANEKDKRITTTK